MSNVYADGGSDLVKGGKATGLILEENYRKNAYHNVTDEYSEDWDLDGLFNLLIRSMTFL